MWHGGRALPNVWAGGPWLSCEILRLSRMELKRKGVSNVGIGKNNPKFSRRKPRTVGGITVGGLNDKNCQGDNYYGSHDHAALLMLRKYGMSKDILVKKMVPSFSGRSGKSQLQLQSVSLITGTFCDSAVSDCSSEPIPFCSVLPAQETQIGQRLKNSSMPCGGSRRVEVSGADPLSSLKFRPLRRSRRTGWSQPAHHALTRARRDLQSNTQVLEAYLISDASK